MFDDREIRYIAGEMDDAEMRAFENSLDEDSAFMKRSLQAAFNDLPKLRDDMPECQFSTEHLWNAIDAAPKAKTPFIGFKQWWVAAPIAASLLVIALMYRPSGNASGTPIAQSGPGLRQSGESVLKDFSAGKNKFDSTNTVAEKSATEVKPDMGLPNAGASLVTTNEPTEERSYGTTKPGKKKKWRQRRNQIPSTGILVASNSFSRQPGGMSVSTVSMKGPVVPGADSAAARSEADTMMSPAVIRGGSQVGSQGATSEYGSGLQKPSEPIVMVSAGSVDENGTQTAVEVKQDDNIVIGG